MRYPNKKTHKNKKKHIKNYRGGTRNESKRKRENNNNFT